MKRKVWAIVATVLVALVAIFVSVNRHTDSFSGTIRVINGQNALINIEEGEILRSGDCVRGQLSKWEANTFQVGDRVRVEYNGGVQESYPLQISETNIELIP